MLPIMHIFVAFVSLLTIVPFYPGPTFAGQVPVIDGVIGGVPRSRLAIEQASTAAVVATTPGNLRVTENSGVCETTPGVYQASGYGDLSATESIWFWFFAARENPDSAPLAVWLNGGPGSSSMIGLFQEHGPCRISNDSTTLVYNPMSWNSIANMLYIDQPVGTGFSYGSLNVGTSQEAAADVWKFLQIFFSNSRFSKYQENEFAIWTESYGGHYGPVFASYFLGQNAAIANGSLSGLPINLKVLGIGDGLTDALIQYPAFIEYASSNPYFPLVSNETINDATNVFTRPSGCRDWIQNCNTSQDPNTCDLAQTICNLLVLQPLAGDRDIYYVLSGSDDPYPPEFFLYLSNQTLMAQIGAEKNFSMNNNNVYVNFANTGDWMKSVKGVLESVIDAGIKTVIYSGDADFIGNYMGVEALVDSLETQFSELYQGQEFNNWTVTGELAGLYKNAGSLSYVRFFGAGHEVPAYSYGSLATGQAALEMFTQAMSGEAIFST